MHCSFTNQSKADDRCAMLLEIDIEDRERRAQLEKEKAVIREAQDWLEGLTKDVSDTISAGSMAS